MTDNPREFFLVSGFCFCLFEARCYSVAQAGLHLVFLLLRRAPHSLCLAALTCFCVYRGGAV